MHTGENLLHCNQCEYKTTEAGHLQTHKKTHSGEKPHRCTACEYSCITAGDLKVHVMRKHKGEKPFKCKQCNYACTTSCHLQRHMKTHTGEKPFNCNQCSKAYTDKIREILKSISMFTFTKPNYDSVSRRLNQMQLMRRTSNGNRISSDIEDPQDSRVEI